METDLTAEGITTGNNLLLNPGCVDLNSDWHLTAGTPAAISGSSLNFDSDPDIPNVDRDGNPRTVPWSMGAYELDPPE